MQRKTLFMFLTAVVLAGMIAMAALAATSATEILRKLDENENFKTAYYESSMEITVGGRKITKTMRAWAEGNAKALVEFTSRRDLGTRILKIGDDLWLYSPTAEEEVRLSGDMLKQGLMGSDFSYQDMLDYEHLTELYQASVLGEEALAERPCYILELTARPNQEVSYYRRKIWVDKERFVSLREELYAPSGKLLKLSVTGKVEHFGARWYATSVVMEDKLKKNSNTRFAIEKIVFDQPIPPGTFTRQRLTAKVGS